MRQPHGQIAKWSLKSSKRNDASSPPRLVSLGCLVNTHGVRGELKLLPYAFPCPTLHKGLTVHLQSECGATTTALIEKVRPHQPFLLVAFQGVTSLDQATVLRDKIVAVEESLLPPLQDGEFYYYQVIGLTVLTTAGQELGAIRHVFFSGGHDVWVVQKDKKEYLIPAVDDIVRSIDVANRQAVVDPPEGLLD